VTKPAGLLNTTWLVRKYSVDYIPPKFRRDEVYSASNAYVLDNYEVCGTRAAVKVSLLIPITCYAVGTPQERRIACPKEQQIKNVFGVRCRIKAYGDDVHIEVEKEKDGCPIGSMDCLSHESLSPVSERKRNGRR